MPGATPATSKEIVFGWARVPSCCTGLLTASSAPSYCAVAVALATGSLLETVTVIRVVSPLDAVGSCCGKRQLGLDVTVMTAAASAGGAGTRRAEAAQRAAMNEAPTRERV